MVRRRNGHAFTRVQMALAAGVFAAVLVTASACGEERGGDSGTGATAEESSTDASPSGSPSESPSASRKPTKKPSQGPPKNVPIPACAGVWVADKKFPHGYPGCNEGRRFVKAQKLFCESGQVVFRYANRYYAVPGYPVQDRGNLKTDKKWRSVLNSCTA